MTVLSQQLLDLQGLDLEIERLQRQIEQLTASIGDQIKVKAGDYAIKQAEGTLRTRQVELRERELDLATTEARIKDHEQRLYSGKGSPRDLEALQRDIAHDRERRDEQEGLALRTMEAVEKAQAEVSRVRTTVERVLQESAAGKEQFANDRAAAQAQLARRTDQRERVAAAIPASAISLYDRLRQRTPDHTAVAEVVQDRCEGCRSDLPSAEIQKARRTPAPVQCANCHRILHVS